MFMPQQRLPDPLLAFWIERGQRLDGAEKHLRSVILRHGIGTGNGFFKVLGLEYLEIHNTSVTASGRDLARIKTMHATGEGNPEWNRKAHKAEGIEAERYEEFEEATGYVCHCRT